MIASVCLMTCVLSMGQPPGGPPGTKPPESSRPAGVRGQWLLSPQLVPGQEWSYSGTYKEEFLSPSVSHETTYQLENTLLVTGPDRVAIQTVLKGKAPRGKTGDPAARPASVRLEIVQVDRLGRIKWSDGTPAHLPLDGPPTLETGVFVEFPAGSIVQDRPWEVPEAGRPPRFWRLVGMEAIHSTTCLKLVGTQKSQNWDAPRADGPAWRRVDTVWVHPQLGLAYRVERVIEHRDPAHMKPSLRTRLTCEFVSRVAYPEHGNLFNDRRQEILKTIGYLDEAKPYLRKPAQHRTQIEVLSKRIDLHVKNQAPNPPYRQALLHVQRRLQAALNGEVPPEPERHPALAPAVAATLGKRAPDFLVTDLINRQSTRLYRTIGRPVLIVFYNPATDTGKQVLRFSQALHDQYRPGLTILALAVTEDVELARKQYEDLHLAFHVLDGRGLHQTFGVDATPRLVLLDADGIVRGLYTGWGRQTSGEITEELRHWLPK
jgi:hypothetical protein